MATRRNLQHAQYVRERIQTSQLINRLTGHAMGRVAMTPSQVTAALGVLRKSLPDLAAIEVNGELEQRHYVAELPLQTIDGREWLRLLSESSSGGQSPALNSPS